MKAKFIVQELRGDIGELTSPSTYCRGLLKNQKKKPQSAIAEFQAQSKKTTLNDKLLICENVTPMQKSLRTLDQELTSNGKDSGGYWNDLCRELSSRLWLPTETVLQDLVLRSSSSFYSKQAENSWFSTTFHCLPNENLLRIFSPFSTYFHVDCTDSENIELKSRKIRIYPTAGQRETLRQWFGVSRYVYNRTIEYLRQPGTKANWIEIKSWLIPSLPDWAKAVPYQIKAIAVKDACQAVKQCKKAFKITGKINKTAFRRRHDPQQTIFIPKSALKPEHGVYYTILGNLHSYESIPFPAGDCRLTFRAGRWFVNVPIETTKKLDNQGRVVAIDPGIRTFATFYSPESCGKVGQGDFSRIQRLCHHLDDLISRMSKETHERRHRMKKAADKMRWKIRDLIDELHHKAALFFVKNFDVILIPKFETSHMSRKGYRKIRAKSVRSMLTFAHFRFQSFLKFKAWEYGKQVMHVNEAYTSKTCSWNGIMKNIGGSKKIEDKGIVVDRDYNGARGIFLRGLCEIQPFSLLRDCTTGKFDELSSNFVM